MSIQLETSDYILPCFILGWQRHLKIQPTPELVLNNEHSDLFKETIMTMVEGRTHEELNKELASQFGVIVTKVKKFPTKDGTWIILDKHTKRMLHKDIKNENEVETLCKKHNYV